ncbi:MAG TPA: adenylate kinase family protein [Methanotrichaceae archaeon]|nr:adenylate kinase family protein [Methanotrichaceae archaeon]
MQIALTGTPGTGKTTVAGLLPYRIIDINALVKDGLNFGTDPERGCLDADMEGLERKLSEIDCDEIQILEGHFSHLLADEAIVLRLNPRELRKRLEARGYPAKKVRENLEAEAIDAILVEAVECCSRVSEIDTTYKTPEEVADLVVKVIRREIELPPRGMNWLEEADLDLG